MPIGRVTALRRSLLRRISFLTSCVELKHLSMNSINYLQRVSYGKKSGSWSNSDSGSSANNNGNPCDLYRKIQDHKRKEKEKLEAARNEQRDKEQLKKYHGKCLAVQKKALYSEIQCMDPSEKKLMESVMQCLRSGMKNACMKLAQKKLRNYKQLEKKSAILVKREKLKKLLKQCQKHEAGRHLKKGHLIKEQRGKSKKDSKKSKKKTDKNAKKESKPEEVIKKVKQKSCIKSTETQIDPIEKICSLLSKNKFPVQKSDSPQNKYIFKLENCIRKEWTDICECRQTLSDSEKVQLARSHKCLSAHIIKMCKLKVVEEICAESATVRPKRRIETGVNNADGKSTEKKAHKQKSATIGLSKDLEEDVLKAKCDERVFIKREIEKLKKNCKELALKKKRKEEEKEALEKKCEEALNKKRQAEDLWKQLEDCNKKKEAEALKKKCEAESLKKRKEEALKMKEDQLKNQLEAEALKKKCEEQKRQEEEALKIKCEEQKKKQKVEALIKKCEEEALKKKCEEEALKKKCEEKALRKKKEEETSKKKKEAEAMQKKWEEEAEMKKKEAEVMRKKCEEEAAKKKKEAEAMQKKREEEAAKKKKEAEAMQKKREEEALRNKCEQKNNNEEEALRKKCEEDDIKAKLNLFCSTLYKTLQRQDFQPGNKVSIVGTGAVGLAVAITLLTKRVTNNIALFDLRKDLCVAERLDLMHGSLFLANCKVDKDTSIECTKDSRVVVITCGARTTAGQSRLQVAQKTADIIKSVMPDLSKLSPKAVFVIVANPADVMTWVARKVADLPYERCFSTGCHLDTARFRMFIAKLVRVATRSVHGFVVGEHGNSSVPLWSSVTIGGTRLQEMIPNIGTSKDPMQWSDVHKDVVEAAMKVIAGKGYTNWAIGLTVTDVVSAIFENSNRILSLSTNAAGIGGIKEEVVLSLPCIVSQCGLHGVVKPQLSDWEKEMLIKSANVLLDAQKGIKF